MKTIFKKWLGRFIKAALTLIAMAGTTLLVWWWLQPPLPKNGLELQEQRLASDDYKAVASDVTETLRVVADECGLPSLSIAVSVHGEVKWAAAFGFADLSRRRKADLETSYRTGSVAKAMTGFAAACLIRRGDLDLDASVRQYVTNYPEKRWDVTLRQLGSHTGGIRHYADPTESSFVAEQFSKYHYASVDEALNLFSGDPLAYEPGTEFLYSTHGFTLLSAAMEAAADSTYPDLMAELVWNPLEMHDTAIDDITKPVAGRAIPYIAIGGRAIHVEGPDPSYKWAGGGLISTPTDLVRMGIAMFSEGFVSENQRKDCFVPRPLTSGSVNPQGYALGWRNETQTDLIGSAEPLAVMHHGGQSPGGSSFIVMIPAGQVCVAVMTNVSLADPWPLREAAYRIAGEFRGVPIEYDPATFQTRIQHEGKPSHAAKHAIARFDNGTSTSRAHGCVVF